MRLMKFVNVYKWIEKPFNADLSAVFRFWDFDFDATMEFPEELSEIAKGESGTITVNLSEVTVMEQGTKFTIYYDGYDIGKGVIKEIIE